MFLYLYFSYLLILVLILLTSRKPTVVKYIELSIKVTNTNWKRFKEICLVVKFWNFNGNSDREIKDPTQIRGKQELENALYTGAVKWELNSAGGNAVLFFLVFWFFS